MSNVIKRFNRHKSPERKIMKLKNNHFMKQARYILSLTKFLLTLIRGSRFTGSELRADSAPGQAAREAALIA